MAKSATPRPRDPVLDEIFALVTRTELARACKISKVAVGLWTRVPDQHVRTVYELCQRRIPMRRIREDLAEQFRPENKPEAPKEELPVA